MQDKKVLIIFISVLLPFALFAQVERWVYTYGGQGTAAAVSVAYGADGYIYAGGQTRLNDTTNSLTVISLTSNAGTERWVYQFNPGSPPSHVSRSCAMVYGVDGNIYAAGDWNLNYWDIMAISLTTNGGQRWVYRYNPAFQATDRAHSISYGSDGNLYIAGQWRYNLITYIGDAIVISLTNGGAERWVWTYDYSGYNDEAWSAVRGADGNVYAALASWDPPSGYDFVVASCSGNTGVQRWVQRYSTPDPDAGFSIVYGADGNIYAAGYYGVYFAVISLTSAGALRWIYRFDDPFETSSGRASSIIYGPDGNLYAAGRSYDLSGTISYLTVISLTTSMGVNWVYRYGDSQYNGNDAYSIAYGTDNNLYAGGWSYNPVSGDYELIVISITNTGTERWVYKNSGPAGSDDRANSVAYGEDGNIYIAGDAMTAPFLFRVISLDPTIVDVEEEPMPEPVDQDAVLSSFFNEKIAIRFNQPINPPLNITLYDAIGRKVYKSSISTTISDFLILSDKSISNLPKGIYFLSISGCKKHYPVAKLVKP